MVSSVSFDGTATYGYEVKIIDIFFDDLVPTQTANEVFVPADPGALVAAAVAVSRDNQQVFVYYPESTVRPEEERAAWYQPPFTRTFSPLLRMTMSRSTCVRDMAGKNKMRNVPYIYSLTSAKDQPNQILSYRALWYRLVSTARNWIE